jgi:hypothetical protein
VSNVSRNDLLVETDSVAHPATLKWTGAENNSRMFGGLPVSARVCVHACGMRVFVACVAVQGSCSGTGVCVCALRNTPSQRHPVNASARTLANTHTHTHTHTNTAQADLHAKLPDNKLNIALENHEVAVLPPQYKRWPILAEWYSVLSTTFDRKGVEYISTIEGKKYPFTGTMAGRAACVGTPACCGVPT